MRAERWVRPQSKREITLRSDQQEPQSLAVCPWMAGGMWTEMWRMWITVVPIGGICRSWDWPLGGLTDHWVDIPGAEWGTSHSNFPNISTGPPMPEATHTQRQLLSKVEEGQKQKGSVRGRQTDRDQETETRRDRDWESVASSQKRDRSGTEAGRRAKPLITCVCGRYKSGLKVGMLVLSCPPKSTRPQPQAYSRSPSHWVSPALDGCHVRSALDLGFFK